VVDQNKIKVRNHRKFIIIKKAYFKKISMKQYIFSHKNIRGGVPAVLESIKKELEEMIKHTECTFEEVETKLS
jgi:NCAIR mutase (PurE)-related protein